MADTAPDTATGQGFAGQFHDAEQRRRADSLGMWLFLATEAMLFSGLFAGLMVYRIMHPDAAKEAALHLQLWIAAANTVLLLTGSFTVAAANTFIRHDARGPARTCLAVTASFGVLFLALKAFEYVLDVRDGMIPGPSPSLFQHAPTALFIDLYYAATGLHALHLSIAVIWLAGLVLAMPHDTHRLPTRIHLVGLYWHFVDVVWIFLYPVLYLVGRNGA